MDKALKFIFIALFFVSCQQKINPSDIYKINGYWEIEKVVLDNGEEKKYTINEYFDYFELSNNKGIRKKVKPQLNGTFLVNETYENIQVRTEKDIIYLDYTTSFAKWTEEVVAISDDKLLLRNPDKNIYYYKKATTITILDNGKKTK